MNKLPIKHIYFVPGMSAGKEIFDKIELPFEEYECHYINWLMPIHAKESLEDYVIRMSQMVKHKEAILVGVSFGGIIVQEMKKYVNPSKVVIISSIKNHNELSGLMRLASWSNFHRLIPFFAMPTFEKIVWKIAPTKLKTKLRSYNKYLSVRNPLYLRWAFDAVVNWKRDKSDSEVIHIHGMRDKIFPIKNIQNFIPIQYGTHIMILTHAKKISSELRLIFSQ